MMLKSHQEFRFTEWKLWPNTVSTINKPYGTPDLGTFDTKDIENILPFTDSRLIPQRKKYNCHFVVVLFPILGIWLNL